MKQTMSKFILLLLSGLIFILLKCDFNLVNPYLNKNESKAFVLQSSEIAQDRGPFIIYNSYTLVIGVKFIEYIDHIRITVAQSLLDTMIRVDSLKENPLTFTLRFTPSTIGNQNLICRTVYKDEYKKDDFIEKHSFRVQYNNEKDSIPPTIQVTSHKRIGNVVDVYGSPLSEILVKFLITDSLSPLKTYTANGKPFFRIEHSSERPQREVTAIAKLSMDTAGTIRLIQVVASDDQNNYSCDSVWIFMSIKENKKKIMCLNPPHPPDKNSILIKQNPYTIRCFIPQIQSNETLILRKYIDGDLHPSDNYIVKKDSFYCELIPIGFNENGTKKIDLKLYNSSTVFTDSKPIDSLFFTLSYLKPEHPVIQSVTEGLSTVPLRDTVAFNSAEITLRCKVEKLSSQQIASVTFTSSTQTLSMDGESESVFTKTMQLSHEKRLYTFTVTDVNGLADSKSYVFFYNSAPTLVKIPKARTVILNDRIHDTIEVYDSDASDTLTIRAYYLNGKPGGEIFNKKVIADAEKMVYFDWRPSQVGTHTVVFEVSDEYNSSCAFVNYAVDVKSFYLSVEQPNEPLVYYKEIKFLLKTVGLSSDVKRFIVYFDDITSKAIDTLDGIEPPTFRFLPRVIHTAGIHTFIICASAKDVSDTCDINISLKPIFVGFKQDTVKLKEDKTAVNQIEIHQLDNTPIDTKDEKHAWVRFRFNPEGSTATFKKDYDYTEENMASQQIYFSATNDSPYIKVNIIDDKDKEGNEFFKVELYDKAACFEFSNKKSIVAVIEDND